MHLNPFHALKKPLALLKNPINDKLKGKKCQKQNRNGAKMTTQLATTQTKMAALKNRATALPEFTNWQPSAGDFIIGEIVGGDVFQHPLYGEQKVMKVRSDTGALINVFLNKWLMNALEGFAAKLTSRKRAKC